MELNPTFVIAINIIIIVTIGSRIVSRRAPVSETLYWLAIIVLIPVFGGILYLVIKEKPIGRKRFKRNNELIKSRLSEDLHNRSEAQPSIETLTNDQKSFIKLLNIENRFEPCTACNLKLLSNENETLELLMKDIQHAQKTINFCTYLWVSEGKILEIENALIAASKRGVKINLLLDDLGSTAFFETDRAERLRKAGIHVVAALKAGIIRGLFRRIDIRNHRKIYTFDNKIAYTGSMNLVDSNSFKPWHNLGNWIDAVIRFEGPAASKLDKIFCDDFFLETGNHIHRDTYQLNASLIELDKPIDVMQLIPAGRNIPRGHMHSIYLMLLYVAKKQITISSPYLIPSDGIVAALCTAAKRGINVRLITTKRSDAKVVQLASEFHYQELHDAGVKIYLYAGALLHAKTLTVDDDFSMVGSLNLDMRSFYINFEICPFIFGKRFAAKLLGLQETYIKSSNLISENWFTHSKKRRISQLLARLISPIL